MTKRILLIGAPGVFGSRLAAMLAKLPDVELVLAARGKGALDDLRNQLDAQSPRASLAVQSLDRNDLAAIKRMAPWLTIDASGPFQDGNYDLARTAIEIGSHYVDLADGRTFVADFPQALDALASSNSVVAVTGASSTPALSHAALDVMTAGWQWIDRIIVTISPGAKAPRGTAVLRAILSYAGQPVRVFRRGTWGVAPGWSGLCRLDMPGLDYRWASLCETPDLDLLPTRFHPRQDALFMAGVELSIMHLGLAALCLLVRWRLIGSLLPLANILRTLADWFAPFGTDRGGMIVEAYGQDELGRTIHARWALWAEAGAGPNTPASPAAALARALLTRNDVPTGARACVGLLSRDAIIDELSDFPIRTREDESHPDDLSLFRRLLGRRFEELPPALRAVHIGRSTKRFSGHAVTRCGKGLVPTLMHRILGLPSTGRTDAEVEIDVDRNGELWKRRFGTARFVSRLCNVPRLAHFEERFGPIRFIFRLDLREGGVRWIAVGWKFWLLPLPQGLAPTIRARADEVEGRYQFRIAVAHRWLGLLFAYRGRLSP